MNRRHPGHSIAAAATCAVLLTTVGHAVAAEEPAEQTDLVLLLDGSGSISATDWSLQLDGYAAALTDRVNVPLDGSVAVSVVQWSYTGSGSNTRVEIPLTTIDDAQA